MMLALREIYVIKSLLEHAEEVELNIHLGLSGFRVFFYDEDGATDFLIHIEHDSIYVRRICLRHRRVGTWSRIFEFLCSIARSQNLVRIVIDHAYTYEMVCWCRKYSLELDQEYRWVIRDIAYGQYSYGVE